MRNYKVKTTVAIDFNDIQNGGHTYEKDEPIVLERARYEELLSKGFVNEGKEIKEEKKEEKKENFDFYKTEEE